MEQDRKLAEHIYEELDVEHIYESLDSLEYQLKPAQAPNPKLQETRKGETAHAIESLPPRKKSNAPSTLSTVDQKGQAPGSKLANSRVDIKSETVSRSKAVVAKELPASLQALYRLKSRDPDSNLDQLPPVHPKPDRKNYRKDVAKKKQATGIPKKKKTISVQEVKKRTGSNFPTANPEITAKNKPASSLQNSSQEKRLSIAHFIPKRGDKPKQDHSLDLQAEVCHVKKNRALEVAATTEINVAKKKSTVHDSQVADGEVVLKEPNSAPDSATADAEPTPVPSDCHRIHKKKLRALIPDLLRSEQSQWKRKSICDSKLVKSSTEGAKGEEDQERPNIPPRLYLLDPDFAGELETFAGGTKVEKRDSDTRKKKPSTHRPRSTLVSSSHKSRGGCASPAKSKDRPHTPSSADQNSGTPHYCNTVSRIAAPTNPHYQPLVSHTIDSDTANEEYTEVKHDRRAKLGSKERLSVCSLQCTTPSESQEAAYMEVKHGRLTQIRKKTVSRYSQPMSCDHEEEYTEVKERTIRERLREIKLAEVATKTSDSKGVMSGRSSQLRSRLEGLLVSSKLQQERTPCKDNKVRYI